MTVVQDRAAAVLSEVELAICPHCELVAGMSHVDWKQHVDDCARIAEGLRRADASRKRFFGG